MSDEPPETVMMLRRLRQGESRALAELFDYYRPRLHGMIRLRMDPRVAPRLDASDVLQEAYIDAARQVQGYLASPRVAFYVWLRALAWERLWKLQRRHLGARRRAVDLEVSLPAESSALLAAQLLARGPSPSEALLQDELRQRVQRALAKLKPADREVILMRDFEDMTNEEVAQALGLSPSGATMRYGRALLRLKEVLTADLSAGDSTP